MAHDLEAPGTDEAPDWASLYRARGDEIVEHRPVCAVVARDGLEILAQPYAFDAGFSDDWLV